jgi:hypothetical protein
MRSIYFSSSTPQPPQRGACLIFKSLCFSVSSLCTSVTVLVFFFATLHFLPAAENIEFVSNLVEIA